MVRPLLAAAAVALAMAGCASPRPGDFATKRVPAPTGQFATDEQKLRACLDLRDHVVEIYTDAYVQDQGIEMTAAERTTFEAGWEEQLAKRGIFERFEQTCFTGVTPRRYRCGMASPTTEGIAACMRVSAR